MIFKILRHAFKFLAAMVIFGCSQPLYAASKSSAPLKVNNMEYVRARKIILKNGWKPVGGPCEQVSESTCFHFPEIGICTETSPGFCGMVFVKNDQCLSLQTRGDPPDGESPGGGWVVSVAIQPSPCSKN